MEGEELNKALQEKEEQIKQLMEEGEIQWSTAFSSFISPCFSLSFCL